MEVYDIQKIQLASSWDRSALESLLQSQGLRLDHDVETAFGVYETSGEEPKLVGCGCAAALLAVFASGAVGPGRLSAVGPAAGPFAFCVGVELAVGAAIALFSPAHIRDPAGAPVD